MRTIRSRRIAVGGSRCSLSAVDAMVSVSAVTMAGTNVTSTTKQFDSSRRFVRAKRLCLVKWPIFGRKEVGWSTPRLPLSAWATSATQLVCRCTPVTLRGCIFIQLASELTSMPKRHDNCAQWAQIDGRQPMVGVGDGCVRIVSAREDEPGDAASGREWRSRWQPLFWIIYCPPLFACCARQRAIC